MSESDKDFESYLQKYNRNATYSISKISYNDLLVFTKDYIQQVFVSKVKDQLNGSYFVVSADEVTGLSN